MTERTCANPNCIGETSQFEPKRQNQLFCTNACKASYYVEEQRQLRALGAESSGEVCKNCGRPISILDYRMGNTEFCSFACKLHYGVKTR